MGEAARTGVHGANRLASNSLLESLVFAWRAAGVLDEPGFVPEFDVTVSIAEEGAVPVDRAELQNLMWSLIGLERDVIGLSEAVRLLASWTVLGGSVDQCETRNLLDLARIIARAALAREESRGAHERTDYPETVDSFARPLAWQARERTSVTATSRPEMEMTR